MTKICNTWLKSRLSITYWYCAFPYWISWTRAIFNKELIYCESKSESKGLNGSLYLLCSKSIQNIYSKLFQYLLAFFLVISLNIQLLMDKTVQLFFGNAARNFLKSLCFVNYCSTYNCELILDNQNSLFLCCP